MKILGFTIQNETVNKVVNGTIFVGAVTGVAMQIFEMYESWPSAFSSYVPSTLACSCISWLCFSEFAFDAATHGAQSLVGKKSSPHFTTALLALNIFRLGQIGYCLTNGTTKYGLIGSVADLGAHLWNVAYNSTKLVDYGRRTTYKLQKSY